MPQQKTVWNTTEEVCSLRRLWRVIMPNSFHRSNENDNSKVWEKCEFATRYTYLVATGTRVQSYPWRTLATAALIPSPPLAATVAAAAAAAAAAVADALPFPLMLLLLLLLFPPVGEIDAPLLSGLTSFIFIPFVAYVARTTDAARPLSRVSRVPYDRARSVLPIYRTRHAESTSHLVSAATRSSLDRGSINLSLSRYRRRFCYRLIIVASVWTFVFFSFPLSPTISFASCRSFPPPRGISSVIDGYHISNQFRSWLTRVWFRVLLSAAVAFLFVAVRRTPSLLICAVSLCPSRA